MLANPTSPIRASIAQLSQGKSLICKGRGGRKRRKSAVVPTKSILKAVNVPIIGGHHVPALQGSPEGWQTTSLLERCREYADRQGARGAAACTVPGRDQRHAGVGMAALDRGARGRRCATADAVAVSGRSLRRSAGGRLDRPRQAVAVAIAPATTVGRVLAGVDAMAGAAAGSHRPDCVQIVIALVVTPHGLPLAYEVLPGNTADKAPRTPGNHCHGRRRRVSGCGGRSDTPRDRADCAPP